MASKFCFTKKEEINLDNIDSIINTVDNDETVVKATPVVPDPQFIEQTQDEQFDQELRNNEMFEKDGKFFERTGINDKPYPVKDEIKRSKISALLKIKENAKEFIRLARGQAGASERQVELADLLIKLYDDFHTNFASYVSETDKKRGKLVYTNVDLLKSDPYRNWILSLETYDVKTKKAKITEYLLNKGVIPSSKIPTKAENIKEAAYLSILHKGKINLETISELIGESEEQVEKKLVNDGLAYLDPEEGWLFENQYLTGYVVARYRRVVEAHKREPNKYKKALDELRKVQPIKLSIYQIDELSLGAEWIPEKIRKDAIRSALGSDTHNFELYRTNDGVWQVKGSTLVSKQEWWELAITGWKFGKVVRWVLNDYYPEISHKRPGLKPAKRWGSTSKAHAVIDEGKRRVKQWMIENHGDELEEIYNEKFNVHIDWRAPSEVPLRFPGMSEDIKLYKHQAEAVIRYLQTGNLLLAHRVGMGKTLTMIAIAMEARRLGIARIPVIAGVLANIDDIKREAEKAYPSANILSIRSKNKGTSPEAMAEYERKILTGDYDLIIGNHNGVINSMPLSKELRFEYISREIREQQKLIAGIENKQFKYNQEASLVKLEEEYADLLDKMKDKEKSYSLGFDTLGIDLLIVDEAHVYKNLKIISKDQNSSVAGSSGAMQLYFKTQYLEHVNPGRGVVLATGTPVSNKALELHTLMRYLNKPRLQRFGIETAEEFRREYTVSKTSLEIVVGNELKPKRRIVGYKNGKVLVPIMNQYIDWQMEGTDEVKVPEQENRLEILEATPATDWINEDILTRAQSLSNPQKISTKNIY